MSRHKAGFINHGTIAILGQVHFCWRFPVGLVVESACNAGDTGNASLILGSRRSPGGGNGNSLQYSCLKNSMDGGAWRATV